MSKLHTRGNLSFSMFAVIGVICVVSPPTICALAAEPAAAPTPAEMLSFQVEMERKPLTSEQEAAVRQLHIARARSALSELQAATTLEKRFYALPDAAMGAFYLERYPEAAQLASETLEKAGSFKSDWNYGNAIHRGHTVKGLLALHDGDIPNAVAELHEAGATPGSPQLDSFGPSMVLAKGLLRAGQSRDVLAYLEECRAFWKMGDTWLKLWGEKIRAGETPNFLMNLW